MEFSLHKIQFVYTWFRSGGPTKMNSFMSGTSQPGSEVVLFIYLSHFVQRFT